MGQQIDNMELSTSQVVIAELSYKFVVPVYVYNDEFQFEQRRLYLQNQFLNNKPVK